jgi:predicted amidohydrolase YtcJ
MKVLERTSMNSLGDRKVRDALKANGGNKVVVSGLRAKVCNNTFALSAMHDGGYEIYMVVDASGGTLGVTGAIDAGGCFENYPEDYAVIQRLADDGQLTVRLAYNLFTQKPKAEKGDFVNWTKTSRYQ